MSLAGAGPPLPVHEVAEFLAAISTHSDPRDAVRAAVEYAVAALGADAGAIVRGDVIASSVGFGAGELSGGTIAGVVAGRCALVDVPGLGVCHAASARVDAVPPAALLLVRSAGGFTAAEQDLLRAMGRVLELTLESLRRLHAEQTLRVHTELRAADNAQLLDSLRERQRLLEHLSRIQRAISRRAPLQQILDAIVESARTLLEADVVLLRLVDAEDPAFLRLAASAGVRPDAAVASWQVPIDDAGIAGRAIGSSAVVTERYEPTASPADDLTLARLRAAIAAPVHDNGEIVGSIVVATRDGGQRYDHTHETLLQALAEHVTLAMTDAKTLEAMYLAFHDSLTGLASRALFLDRLQHGLSGAQRAKTTLGLLFIDLDRFKMVNDTLGHGAGDELLVQVADRVRGCLRISDTAARFGGDEFAVLLQDTTETGAQRVADRVIDAVRAPYAIGGREVFVNASIGIALSAPGLNDANELLRSADVAMYEAKRNGKGRHELFEPGMHAELMSRLELEADLRRAIDGNEFVLHYQPIVALETGRITAVEALVRWQHPRRGIVMPMDFIPLAEETGLIVPLGRWVLEEACRQAAEWQNGRATDVPLSISVNLSALQLEQRDVAASVAEALTAVALDPSCLILEITETLLMQDRKDTLAKMAELRSLGVRLAIDDFGTGYSSLSYLRQFPINILKIDKSFVDGIGAGPEESAFARAIVRLGQTLHLEMVAEGIEDLAQVDELRRAHCQSGQGYHFARPMPAAELTEILSGTPDDREQRLLPALPASPTTSVPLLASTAGATA